MAQPTAKIPPGMGRESLAEAVRAIVAGSNQLSEVESMAFSPSPYASSHLLVDVAVSVGGRLLHMVMKDTSSPTLAAEAARPNVVVEPDHEANVYSLVLSGLEGPPLFYGALHQGTHHWLLLERLRGRELTKVGDLRVWGLAARWLGRFHAMNRIAPAGGVPRNAHYFSEILQRALPGVEASRANLRLDRLVRGWDHVAGDLLSARPCFMHGDAFPANVVLGPGNRIGFVDWELAATGPGPADLAALTAGSWAASEREAMLNAYRSGLNDVGTHVPSRLARELLMGRILVAVEMMGALRQWEPPSHQAWNWPGELSRLLDDAGL